MFNRLAEVVYSLVENSYEFTEEGFSYDEACDILNLTEGEKAMVLSIIDEDLRHI